MKPAIQYSFISCCLPLAFSPLTAECQSTAKELPQQPNVLFILTDDLQASSIHALGNEDVYTPAIDSLIAEGVTFTNTYTNGALCGALSMPSRAMLMTGRGLYNESTYHLPATIPPTWLPYLCHRKMALGQSRIQPFLSGGRQHLFRWNASL